LNSYLAELQRLEVPVAWRGNITDNCS